MVEQHAEDQRDKIKLRGKQTREDTRTKVLLALNGGRMQKTDMSCGIGRRGSILARVTIVS